MSRAETNTPVLHEREPTFSPSFLERTPSEATDVSIDEPAQVSKAATGSFDSYADARAYPSPDLSMASTTSADARITNYRSSINIPQPERGKEITFDCADL